ncbi:MAG: AMP-binding protein [Chlamydiales bacterium]|nr:AMP-binding protein [Chlamydiales bacterium]
MMKHYVAMVILYIIKMMLWVRYRVHYKGVENLNPETLKRPGGVLFLPNHPTILVDPSLVVIGVYNKLPIRPIIVEYMYYTPGVNWLMRFMDAIPIPNHFSNTNSLKRKKSEKALEQVVEGVKNGENFLIYPGGKVKRSNYEQIGGASGVHGIIHASKEANVVLVRVTGLYGSIFSSALTGGKVPYLFPTLWQGIKIALKNLIFFTPRRDVTIEYVPAPADFPYDASRLELNRYLEHWYNRPDGIDPKLAKETLPGESLKLVSYSRWSEELPNVECRANGDREIDLARIPPVTRDKVYAFIAKLTDRDVSQITPNLNLSSDLGLDSLDAADILAFLQDQFGVEGVPPSELTTVERLIGIAAKEVSFEEEEDEHAKTSKKWFEPLLSSGIAETAPGNIIPEVFWNSCAKWGKRAIVADVRSGVLTYSTLKLRTLLLAEHLRKLDGKYVGILLPSSVAAAASILACQIAGKIPVMINWTVGSLHLESVVALSGVKHVLSSWAFLDRLENVELGPVEDKLILLEDLKSQFSLGDKLKAVWRSKQSTQSLMKTFGLDKLNEDTPAVVLFTSGTESMPKGVPLSHKNILSNQRSILKAIGVTNEDVVLAILPPFHSFGFTVSSLIGILGGLRTVYSADPTNGKQIVKAIAQWRATIAIGAPTFLKAILRVASAADLSTVRYIVTGAEKAPPELMKLCEKFQLDDRVFEGYGITECSPVLTLNKPGVEPQGVGQPMDGVELCIVHPETHEPLGLGQHGLVLARGPNIFAGYLNPGLASPFLTISGKQWYSTGDLGYLDEMGRLTLVGRLKRFIKVGGEMVSLGAIEDALLKFGVQQGWPTPDDSPTLAIVAEEREGDKPRVCLFARFQTDIEEINGSLRTAGFSNLIKVSEVKQLSAIPIMGSGKINYRELKELMS